LTASPWGFGYANGNSKAEALGLAVTFGVAAMIDWTNESEKEQRDSALEDRMAKADAAIDAKALDAIAKDMGLHDGANRDAALGLPLVMTGPDATARLNEMIGTTPGHKPSRKDAASLSTKPDTYGEVLAREFDAYAELFNLMTTKAQIDALIKYADAVSASRAARGEIVKGAQ